VINQCILGDAPLSLGDIKAVADEHHTVLLSQPAQQKIETNAERHGQTLFFNAQGSSPFLLAWGNKAAEPQAIALNSLIPSSLRTSIATDALPYALFGEKIELGGKARLTAVSAAEQTDVWKKSLIWVALIMGAGALVLLTFKIWRDLQKKPE